MRTRSIQQIYKRIDFQLKTKQKTKKKIHHKNNLVINYIRLPFEWKVLSTILLFAFRSFVLFQISIQLRDYFCFEKSIFSFLNPNFVGSALNIAFNLWWRFMDSHFTSQKFLIICSKLKQELVTIVESIGLIYHPFQFYL